MNLKELYSVGQNFESFIGEGSKSERDRIPKNYSRIILSEEEKERIKKINDKIYFLVSGEVWCPDCQLNMTVLKKICELNNNFDMKIISKGRGEKFLKPLLNLEEFKVPIIIPLNENFEICGKIFKERPLEVKKINFEENKLNYLKGKYLKDTLNEIIFSIEK
ncbi:MAG: thioredoxin family protein [Cetobacterium sp.]|nr:thioredoxin family protein [Cetobacterium sp.]